MVRGSTKDKVLRRDALPVPENLPSGTRCIQMEIPDDDEYELQFYSLLRLLTKWNSYQQDGSHKAADVANIWKKVLQVNAIKACEVRHSGVEVEDMSRFRVDPDNNCILQIECKPDEWETFWDISPCVTEGAKQAINGAPLDDGECREWDVALKASEKWLLPVSVSANDVVTVTDPSGAWNMGTLAWYCPSGELYTLGICNPDTGTLDAGNPIPGALTGRLIMEIDGAFYDAYNVELTVPGGVSDEQLTFQANDSSLSGNSGTITFHVKVCRPSPVLLPISLTYAWGSGATLLDPSLDEWTIGVTSSVNPGVQGQDVDFTLSIPLKISVLSNTGFVQAHPDPVVYEGIQSGGSDVSTVSFPYPPNAPEDLTEATGTRFYCTTGRVPDAPSAFSLQVKLRRP